MCFDNIVERLKKIQESILSITSKGIVDPEKSINNDFITITSDDEKTIVLIRGEDHTMSKLLVRTMYELDPSIGFVNDSLEHPSNRTIMLNIVHLTPIKILLDSIDVCSKQMTTLQNYFV